jgi:hypothetical protein
MFIVAKLGLLKNNYYLCTMKEEHYIKLVDKLGKEKADKIKQAIEADTEQKRLDGIKEHERLERMLNAMIPKKDMKDCQYYNGHRWRGKHVAMWDANKGLFLTINFTMGDFFLEELKHFEDVAETRIDGFIPFEEINKIEK